MIRLPPLKAPTVLRSSRTRTARARAKKFFTQPSKARAQQRFQFDDEFLHEQEITDALASLTSGKCAYCESALGPARPLEVEHFRPTQGAVNLDGSFSPDHYWWLAYDWDNLIPTCAECARMKGARFPVASRRAHPPARGESLAQEGPYLLDPRHDEPQLDLVFVDSGEVVSKSERGRVTIEVLGLNRRQLVEDRAAALKELQAEWPQSAKRRTPSAKTIEMLTSEKRPYAGLRRQFLATWLQERGRAYPPDATVPGAEVAAVSSREQRELKTSFDVRKVAQEDFSVARPGRPQDYFITTRVVERVVIENVRVIESLELEISAPTAHGAPWLMLLGENGTGKSSVLQAIALALMDDARRKRLGVRPQNYLRNGERRGFVEVHLTGGSKPVRLDITKSSFRTSTDKPKVLLLGYGATRLLPRPDQRPTKLTSDFARVRNLFDPFSPLGNATDWLLNLPPQRFEAAAQALKGILALDVDASLQRNRRAERIELQSFGDRVPIEQLSDGYQSVLGLSVDIMSVMFHRWPTMDVAEGVVAIDELGAHVHPRWRMRIVGGLRRVFPRVQFLSSTHDPLCLRGLVDGEVTVLHRDPDGGVFKVDDLPPIAGLRVDQLLTSEVFGLNSTVDPELDALFTRYYDLKGKWTRTDGEESELSALRDQLEQYELLGQNPRERLMLEAADDFLAQERRIREDGERIALRKETRERLAQLWAETEPLKPPARS